MSNSISKARTLPSSSLQQDSLINPGESYHQQAQFPVNHRLIVTTTQGVYTWGPAGIFQMFHSGSSGIVAAKNLGPDQGRLAIADSQVVVLHDVHKGMQRSYRLKGSEVIGMISKERSRTHYAQGQVRLLRYAGNSTGNLFFTTSLQNSVQAYSLKDSKLLSPQATHPSPPSVFAVSCDSQLLLSISARPTAIHLRRINTDAPPLLLHPQCSSSAVVAAAFHPERPGIFLLAFADGSIAVYDAIRVMRRNGTSRGTKADFTQPDGEIACMKKLHTPTTTGEHNDKPLRSTHDARLPGSSVAATSSGIASVALLPDRKATAVTVGADGKCSVVDFTQPSRNKAVLLSTWRLRRPATSMSVVYARDSPFLDQADGSDDWSAPSGKDFCIAIGRQDGKVMLFDLDGHLLSEELLDSSRNRIVDVEWETSGPVRPKVPRRKASSLAGTLNVVNGDSSSGTTTHEQLLCDSLQSRAKDDSLFDLTRPAINGTISPPRRPIGVPESNRVDKDEKTPAIDPRISGISVGVLNHLDLSKGFTTFREDDLPPMRHKKKHREVQVYQKSNAKQEGSPFSEEQDMGEPTSGSQLSSPPVIPPRPTPKEDGIWYLRRAQKALEAAAADPSREIIINGRRVSAASLRSRHRGSVSSCAKKRILMGPRPHRKRSPPVSLRTKVASSQDTSLTAGVSADSLDAAPKGVTGSPASSAKSYKTTSPGLGGLGDSETSSDTIVDWSTGVRQRPRPTPIPSENEPFLTSNRLPPVPTKPGSLTFKHRPTSRSKSKAVQALRKGSGKAIAKELNRPLLLDASHVDNDFQSKLYLDLEDIKLQDGTMPDEALSSVPALRIDKAKRRRKGHISILVSPASSAGSHHRNTIYPDLADLDYDPDSTPSEGLSLQDPPEYAKRATDEHSLRGDNDTEPALAAWSTDDTDSGLSDPMLTRQPSASTRQQSGQKAGATPLDPACVNDSNRLIDDPDQTDVSDQQDLVADSATAVILDSGHYSRPISGTSRPMSKLHMSTHQKIADQREVAHQGGAGSIHGGSRLPQEIVEALPSQGAGRLRVSAIQRKHSCNCGEDIRDFLSSCFADLTNKELIRNEKLISQFQALLLEQDQLFRATVQGVEKRLLKRTFKSTKPGSAVSRSQCDEEWEDVTDMTEGSKQTAGKPKTHEKFEGLASHI